MLAIDKSLTTHSTDKVTFAHMPLDVYMEAAACCEPLATHFTSVFAQSLVQLLVDEQ